MSRFVKTLALFVAGLQLVPAKADDAFAGAPMAPGDDDAKGVSLQPLNGDFDNLFASHASHSSHSSHASHSSHYSGSSGTTSGYVAPVTPYVPATPVRTAVEASAVAAEPAANNAAGTGNASGGGVTSSSSPGSSATAEKAAALQSPKGAAGSPNSDVAMTRAEKLHLQIFRVQIRLNSLGLYDGVINGILDPVTQKALKQFQQVKNFPASGQMTTETLNALGIPAVK